MRLGMAFKTDSTTMDSNVGLNEWMYKLVVNDCTAMKVRSLADVCSIINWIELALNNIWCLLVLQCICRSSVSLLKCLVCPYNCSLAMWAMWHLLNRFRHFLINYTHISCGTGFFASSTFISTLSLSTQVDKPTLSHSVTFGTIFSL